MKRTLALILSILTLAAACAGCGDKVVYSGKTESVKKTVSTADSAVKSTDALLNKDDIPAPNLDAADAEYQKKAPVKGEEVAILHTNKGDISFKFFPEVAPLAVNNFKALAKAGRYNNTIFHRVIKDFMIQGGDYTNFDGTGGVSAYGEEFSLEISDYLSNSVGAVAMANRGPDTNGSQFYINQVDNNYLDGNYTVFGQVYDGMDVVDTIADVETSGGMENKPLEDIVLTSVEIVAYEGQ